MGRSVAPAHARYAERRDERRKHDTSRHHPRLAAVARSKSVAMIASDRGELAIIA
jgi:hypothetical protein